MASPSPPQVRWTPSITKPITETSNTAHLPTHRLLAISPTPVRPRACTPSPPSPRSASSSDSSSPPASGASSPIRGRPLTIFNSSHALVSRATARRRAGPSSIDFGTHPGTSNLPSISLPHAPQPTPLPDESILEPFPGVANSFLNPTVMTVLQRAETALSVCSNVDLSTFGAHRDTFALLDLYPRAGLGPELPHAVWKALAGFLDVDTVFSLRLTCRAWCAGITAARPLKMVVSAAQRMPMELLGEIYELLEPGDFDSARRTCRAWMVAGLDIGLLEGMCRKGGWWGGVLADREHYGEAVGGQWGYSRRLASECSLVPGWGGNGFDGFMAGEGGGPWRTSMRLTSETDFRDLASGAALHFTASTCGKFVMVAEGCVVYVYRLHAPEGAVYGGLLELYAMVVCPKRVLAVSMDTSSRRYTVAALLDERMGMVCDIGVARSSGGLGKDGVGSDAEGYSGIGVREASPLHIGDGPGPAMLRPDNDYIAQLHSYSPSSDPSLSHINYHVASLPLASPAIEPSGTSTNAFDFSTSTPQTLYTSLCSPSAPPISVAICPHRRCVAFGCATGIELHWVDALTGQDLNRWFPITAPSDFLYFLPPRQGVDAGRKLRLISSEGGRGQKGSLGGRFGVTGRIEWMGNGLQNGNSTHYKAVPLSDGDVVLFTDPGTGKLCLGGDTTTPGPTRLERRVVFEGPPGKVPSVYAAGGELRWGVRVLVAYEDHLWVFCVPPDVDLRRKDGERETVTEENGEVQTDNPLVVHGVEIGALDGLMDLAVDSSGGSLTVWGFAATGMVQTWQIDTVVERGVRKRAVLADGTVMDLEDSDGDFIMRDAPPVMVEEYDGSSSVLLGFGRNESEAAGLFAEQVVESPREMEMGKHDEGYWSAEESGLNGGGHAIHVPPRDGRWSQDTDSAGPGTGQMLPSDVPEMYRLECDVL